MKPYERMPYYRALWKRWKRETGLALDEKWLDIEQAVLAGR